MLSVCRSKKLIPLLQRAHQLLAQELELLVVSEGLQMNDYSGSESVPNLLASVHLTSYLSSATTALHRARSNLTLPATGTKEREDVRKSFEGLLKNLMIIFCAGLILLIYCAEGWFHRALSGTQVVSFTDDQLVDEQTQHQFREYGWFEQSFCSGNSKVWLFCG